MVLTSRRRLIGMVFASLIRDLIEFIPQKGIAGALKMVRELALALRERAVAALQTSTTMLKVSQTLLRQGNNIEAARLRNEARYKRNESILLMDQAREVATIVQHSKIP